MASTLSVEQLSELPLVSRNALYAVALLPGVATTGGPRGAVINGLPNNTVNVTIDGISTGQHAAVDRRLLLDGHAAHGRGRRSHA